MDLSIYLAATGAELQHMVSAQNPLAYMACHFSPSGSGISGLPSSLPAKSMLMLTDEFPIQDHEPHRVSSELLQAANDLKCSHILLDFQRANNPKAALVASAILNSATIPVGISAQYAREFSCPVLVCPSPLWTPLSKHLAPWKGREIWLEAILEDATVTVTHAGSSYQWNSPPKDTPFYSDALCVSYSGEQQGQSLQFHLHRGRTELSKMLEASRRYGVTLVIGLYQQLGQ